MIVDASMTTPTIRDDYAKISQARKNVSRVDPSYSVLDHKPWKRWTIGAAIVSMLSCVPFFTFETVAEFKFNLHWHLPFNLYFLLFDIPDAYAVMPCSELGKGHLDSSLIPIVFKGCIKEEARKLPLYEFSPFGDHPQNLFSPCETYNEVIRRVDVEDYDGNITEVVEKVPCSPLKLHEMIAFHQAHNLSSDGPYWDVHTYQMDSTQETALDSHMKDRNLIPDNFHIPRMGRTVILAHYFNSGTTAVAYLHSHSDRFLSFGMFESTKSWILVNPKYHHHFEYEWTGQALLIKKEHTLAQKVLLDQEPGDILFVPPWWIHRTTQNFKKASKNFNINFHMMTPRSFSGLGAWLLMKKLGLNKYFFAQY